MDDNREGIQTDESIPPWEQPGCFRLDCEPHRGDLLLWLGFVGFILGFLALLPLWGWVPGLLGIPFNLWSRYLAKVDLAKMQAGMMDRSGEAVTGQTASLNTGGLVGSIIGTVVWGGLALLQWWSMCRFPPT
jgi:hypothetical protein